MNEAFSEPAEFHQRPELDRNKPAKLFLYARDMQRWIKERVSEQQLPDAIDHLVNRLEHFVTESFDSVPELTITSSDINYTRDIHGQGSRHAIENGPLPLSGDAQVLGEHEVQGMLFGFHRGEDYDLRVYVSVGDAPRYFMGGIYTPLLSVGVENSTIRLTDYVAAEGLETLEVYINEQLPQLSWETQQLAGLFRETLSDTQKSPTIKLHECSEFLTKIVKDANIASPITDALLEMTKMQLRLYEPQDIQTHLYQKILSEYPVSAYKPVREPTFFTGVEGIHLVMIGETDRKSLGLLFINNEQPVQIPVQYITSIYRSAR